jgi:deoxyadenosine/deoxycytidine kinase
MIVVINGSFGVGKTTVAKLLRKAFPGSVVYDPERTG